MKTRDFVLDKQQRAAIHTKGPVLVRAGVGTGKTSVLVAKYVDFVAKGFKVENVALITFTNKAAQELKFRATNTLQQNKITFSNDQLNIGTFHKISLDLLRKHDTA